MTESTIADLIPDPRNARKHNPRNLGMIVDSLHEVGAARSIVIDEDNNILAGNGTIEAAAEAGIEKLHIVEADGETIVAVRRTGLTPEQKTRLALLDNRTAELADWDSSIIAAFEVEGINLSDLWHDEELTELLQRVPNFSPVSEDEQGRLDEKAKVKCPECGHEFTPA